jgi:hypothetical protein
MRRPKTRIKAGLGVTLRLEQAQRLLPADVFLRNILR